MNKNHQNFRKLAKLIGASCGGLVISLSLIPQVTVAQQQPNSKVNPCPKIFYEEPHNNRVVVPQGCPPNALTQRLAAQGSTSLDNVPTSPAPDQISQGVTTEVPNEANSSVVNPGNVTQAPYSSGSNSQSYNYSSQRQTSMTRSGQNTSRSTSETEIYTSSDNSVNGPTPRNIPNTLSTLQDQSYPRRQQRQNSVIPPLPQTPNARIALANGKVSVKLVNDTAAPITYQAIGDTAPRTLQGKSEVMLQGLSTPTTVTFQRQDKGLLMVSPQSTLEPGMLEVRFRETTDLKMDKRAMTIQENGAVFLN